jgi:signal transduction histidine kinase
MYAGSASGWMRWEAVGRTVGGVTIVERVKQAQAWLRGMPVWMLDSALAAVFVLAGFLTVTSATSSEARYEPVDWRAYLLMLAIALPYFVRRRYPLTVFVVATVALVGYVLVGFHEGVLPTVVLVGMYTVGAYCPPRRIVVAFGVLVVALLVLLAGVAPDFNAADFVANLAFFTVAGLFGWSVQSRRLRLEALEQRAEALEREQEEEARRAVADERLRIAQELHDVMAHSMSVIAVQANVGMHVVEQDPTEAKRALENISSTSRSTLTELRRLLGVLRDGEGAAYEPASGLEDLSTLVHDVTEAGVPVSVSVEGSLDELPPGLGFTGYRIVQEALTNVLRHAGPSSATVAVRHADGSLHIEVRDDGRGVNGRAADAGDDGGGHGLAGMRERVAVYGGSLAAGPQPGGGFAVVAHLPYGPDGRGGSS